MTPRFIKSTHAKNFSGSIEIEDDMMVRVLTVETDLKLNSLDPNHDKEAVDQLLAELKSSMGDLYDRAVLKQARDDA